MTCDLDAIRAGLSAVATLDEVNARRLARLVELAMERATKAAALAPVGSRWSRAALGGAGEPGCATIPVTDHTRTEMNPTPKNDKEWQASDDYRALVRAEELKMDPDRMKAAMAWGEKEREAIEARAEAAENLAKMWKG